jgi:nucleoside-diphosphate-sugar epimerase
MRVVVTGGSGKAGQWVVRALAERGHEVVNFDLHHRPELELPGAHCRVDLADAGEVYDAVFQYRPESVCHLAANPQPEGQARVDVFDNNVRTAFNVLQAAGDAGARRVIYASSEMATGLLTEGVVPGRIPFDESERRPSPNAYALSKYISEVIADSVAVRYPATAWVGLRINNVVPPDGYGAFEAEWEDPGRVRGNFWSYVDARDVGTGYVAALEGESGGHEVFLLAAADTRARRPLRELMAEYYDGYDSFSPVYEHPASAFDCSKLERFFGWKPSYSWRDPDVYAAGRDRRAG